MPFLTRNFHKGKTTTIRPRESRAPEGRPYNTSPTGLRGVAIFRRRKKHVFLLCFGKKVSPERGRKTRQHTRENVNVGLHERTQRMGNSHPTDSVCVCVCVCVRSCRKRAARVSVGRRGRLFFKLMIPSRVAARDNSRKLPTHVVNHAYVRTSVFKFLKKKENRAFS